MLEILYTDDEEVLTPLREKLGCESKSGVSIVLTAEKVPIGLCVLSFDGEKAEFLDFKVDKSFDFGTTDFFFRAVLFKLSFAPVVVVVPSDDKRLEALGFRLENGKMSVVSTEVTFNSHCGH